MLEVGSELERLVVEGMGVDVEQRWGAGFLAGRYLPGPPPWSWPQVVRPVLEQAVLRRGPDAVVLDLGTGDGAVLAGLSDQDVLPRRTLAQEEWWPTVAAARATLGPRGVALVVARGAPDNVVSPTTSPRAAVPLPLADDVVDVVLDRHEAFDPAQDVPLGPWPAPRHPAGT